MESCHRHVGLNLLNVGWIALDIGETAGLSPHSSNVESSPETPYQSYQTTTPLCIEAASLRVTLELTVMHWQVHGSSANLEAARNQ